jgi:hypothetical protein
LNAIEKEEILLISLTNAPVKMGIEISDIRNVIGISNRIGIRKGADNSEFIYLGKSR